VHHTEWDNGTSVDALTFASVAGTAAATTGIEQRGVIVRLLTKLAAVSAIGVASVGVGTVAWAEAEADTPPSIVEDFAYPNADQILADHGIKLHKGDGNILFVNCDVAGDVIQIESYDHPGYICFQLRGTTGYLSLEISNTVFVRSENKPIEATVILAGQDKPSAPETVPANSWTPFGEAANLPPATLLELRV
jgi:hypothetical protein